MVCVLRLFNLPQNVCDTHSFMAVDGMYIHKGMILHRPTMEDITRELSQLHDEVETETYIKTKARKLEVLRGVGISIPCLYRAHIDRFNSISIPWPGGKKTKRRSVRSRMNFFVKSD